ncbi:flagellar motor switch protein FliN [Thiolapillus sp.]
MSEQTASATEDPVGVSDADVAADMPSVDNTEAVATEPQLEPEQETRESGYESAEFETLDAEESPENIEPNLDVILNIPVTLSMQIGATRMTIEELMRLNRGSVVKLDRLAGEPMDVLVNGTLIAHGEVVVVNEKFGIRLLDVISPAERVKKLR